jgi:hypothetical protein
VGVDQPYLPDAIVPLEQWRQPTPREAESLQEIIPCVAHRVWIVRAPVGPVNALRDVGVADAQTQERAGILCADPIALRALRELREFAKTLVARDEGFQALGVSVRRPGLHTTTVDATRTWRIGLHLDSWDRGDLSMRHESRSRLNINLGRGSRHLFLVPVPVSEIWEWAGRTNRRGPVIAPSDLVRQFLRNHTVTLVYGLEIQPGEAYIANTELFPHDSTTIGKREPDVSYTVLGYFNGDRSKADQA